MAVYALNFIVFASIYFTISDECGLGLKTFRSAFFLSMETLATIGYGIDGPGGAQWGDCLPGLFALMVQILSGVILDSLIIGIVFVRIARPQRRASTIVFSKHAVLRQIRGAWYLMIQVAEQRKHQLIEAHVRCCKLVVRFFLLRR